MICTVDSDVLMLAMAAVNEIQGSGLPLAQEKAFNHEIELYPLVQRSAMFYYSYKRLVDVTQYHPLLVVEGKQHGKFGRYVMRLLQHFAH